MRVRDVMDPKVVTIPLGTPYHKVAKTLSKGKFSGAPVVDGAGLLVGIVSEKDLFRVLYPQYQSFYESPDAYLDFEAREQKAEEIADHPVELYMTAHVWTVEPHTPVMKAGALMLAKGIHRMPVIERGKLVGIVTRGRIFRVVMSGGL